MLYGSIVQNGLKHAKTDFRTKVILNYGNTTIRLEAINLTLDHFSSLSLPRVCLSHAAVTSRSMCAVVLPNF